MLRFIVRRLLAAALTVVLASMLVFSVAEFFPGSVARKTLGEYALQEQVDILIDKLQLDDPLPVRYVRWAGVLLGVIEDPLGNPDLNLGFRDPRGHQYFGNFGYSTLYKEPINTILWPRLANTAVLAGIAYTVLVPLSLALGVLAGMREGSRTDRVITVGSLIAISIPEFAWGVGLIAVFTVFLGVLPGNAPLDAGGGWSIGSQFVLPALVLVLYVTGYPSRMVRASMAEVMTKPYVRTAVLKGLPNRHVVLRHAFRNALIAPFTVLLMQINWLITGVVVTETVFGFPGFGRMVVEAALFGDIAVIEAVTMVAVLIAVGTQFIGDVGYMLLNPRIRFQ